MELVTVNPVQLTGYIKPVPDCEKCTIVVTGNPG